ncbi:MULTISPECIES: response regulator transcription factor [Actinomyces]|uniref:Sensory transduction protein RegX3 n=1 Tax=Actinomyces respiraculi TaxID=2744574 RepID=A0A7T0PW96_9ACTO|nr:MULTISPECIES: response regulator transcription factor [Actinomyces]QPL05288.1 response regulator transcription factor [Actinomyces respiraculi]
MTRILLVEDEESYREPLAFSLRRDGYEVVEAEDGLAAIEAFEAAGPAPATAIDLVLLDLMLPRLSGTEVCRRIRRVSSVPVIMLTAKDSEVDKVVGLEIGADDYVTKPYSYRELIARVHAVLRRSREEEPEDVVLEAGRVRMDVERHEVSVAGEPVAMPLREFELLELFLRNPDRVLTRGQIIDRVWGADYVGDTKTLDVHVKRIRAKIEQEPGSPRMLTTVRGLGYKFVARPAER